ncbi:hypothetical protein GCM10022419_118520 [Nonomuraea rosea]|uniref:Uncharacterized protein n=1 Tax=Nonomuraea rosea TaxID=638574 RepID=A0ABP6ZNZ1_9ACTN
MYKDGLALRFVPLLIDEAVADAQCGCCHLDAITLRFSEADFVMKLARLTADRLQVAFEASFRLPEGSDVRMLRWELMLSGRPGTARQRAAILREIRNARRDHARGGPSRIRTTWNLIARRLRGRRRFRPCSVRALVEYAAEPVSGTPSTGRDG